MGTFVEHQSRHTKPSAKWEVQIRLNPQNKDKIVYSLKSSDFSKVQIQMEAISGSD